MEVPPSSELPSSGATLLASLQIFVVDDTELNLKLLQVIIRNLFTCEIFCFTSAAAVLDALNTIVESKTMLGAKTISSASVTTSASYGGSYCSTTSSPSTSATSTELANPFSQPTSSLEQYPLEQYPRVDSLDMTPLPQPSSTGCITTSSSLPLVSAPSGSYGGGWVGILLTDIHMPEMDGIELTNAIRKRYSSFVLPIIGATADFSPALEQQCLQSGMQHLLPKPILASKLRELILSQLTSSLGEMSALKYVK